MPGEKTAGLDLERDLWRRGFRRVIGMDEAGRGAWAGPVMAGAVCLPPQDSPDDAPHDDLRAILAGVRDSKQMTARARERLFDRITTTALAWGVGSADAQEIDDLGVVPATCLAMRRALEALRQGVAAILPDFLLMDLIRCTPFELYAGESLPYQSYVRGDSRSLSIAAASILAKVSRDRHMIEQDQRYPEYGFAVHKGYGVPSHRRAIETHGALPLHRMSFAPLREAPRREVITQEHLR
ncbi:MAG: ribonuclease HII [Anaerolineae bacterium]|nr:ribonuclease HII [Anaerolineae bacterium]NUQ03285.1 ribonuclease HII [Anaerolineae bacterium]